LGSIVYKNKGFHPSDILWTNKMAGIGQIKVHRIFQIIICLFLLTGCGFPIVRSVEVTRVIPQTVVVTELLVVVYTATPGSITSPITTTTPGTAKPFVVWSPQQVLEAFQSAGLEVSNPRAMTSDDYGLVPMLAVNGTRFFIPSVCVDCGGRIMSFSNEEDLTIVRDYYAQMGRFSAVLFSWVFVKDNILVQINGELPEANARKYEAALEGIK
jgi:hypothetical protein